MQIALKNVQAIKDYVFDFPDTGIVEFVGPNSNNKSALERVLTAIINVQLMDEIQRTDLINDFEEIATVVIIVGNKSLGVQIHKTRVKTIMQYTPDLQHPKENVVTRTLRDGGWEELIREFGFRSYGKGEVSLQTYPTFGPIPFINTSGRINNEIVEDSVHDPLADTFCENYQNITFKKASSTLKATKQQVTMLENQLKSMHLYDWKRYQALGDRLRNCKEIITHWTYIHLEPIEIFEFKSFPNFPTLHIEPIALYDFKEAVNIPYIHLEPIDLTPVIPFGMYIEPMEDLLDEYLSVLNGECPTCGKPLLEGGEHCDNSAD